MDQLRYDTLGFMQERLPWYSSNNIYVKIRTPHLDGLAMKGAAFEVAYAQSASCAPCRATLKTGCTVARHGIATNQLIDERAYRKSETVRSRIEKLRSLEQILRFDAAGYNVETYGKWHFPTSTFYAPVRYNYYDYNSSSFGLDVTAQTFEAVYRGALESLLPGVPPVVANHNGDQLNTMSQRSYTPLPTDPRYGMPTHTPDSSLPAYLQGLEVGQDALDANFTSTAILGDMALRALDRIMTEPGGAQDRPFMLSVHFNAPVRYIRCLLLHRFASTAAENGVKSKASLRGTRIISHLPFPFLLCLGTYRFRIQHPPRIAASKYLKYYQANRDRLWVTPSLDDPLLYSAYNATRQAAPLPGFRSNNASFIKDFTSVYYAMIEQVDEQIGRLLERLQRDEPVYNRTLIVFTSDHGEQMGSHAMTGKNRLFEESTRVPLLLIHPSKIPAGIRVRDPVSHLDVVSTVLDYSGASPSLDNTDGTSLRRWIEKTSFNGAFDEGVVVVESDPVPSKVGSEPNFMVRKGPYKLMMPRLANSSVIDMLYNVEADPFEMDNLLGTSADDSSVIGKAEHLKILLLEWLQRHDTDDRYFSSNVYNHGIGRGDVAEIASRRTWTALPYWQSDSSVTFGSPAAVGSEFIRNEYVYVGGHGLRVSGVVVGGPDASFFDAQVDLQRSDYTRIKVSFRSSDVASAESLVAWLVVSNSATTTALIPIVGSS
jgi:arylsulfatase A-like enzyme